MAKFYNGIMGPFNGHVGTVVGYVWNGKPCMRAYNRTIKNPRTEAQQEHRNLFRQQVQLAASMRWALTTTMTDMARADGMTAYNLFVSVNQPSFGSDAGRLAVDYSQLRLSVGDVMPVEPGEAVMTDDNVVEVSFDRGAGRGFDYVYMYVYVPELQEGCLAAPVYRRDKKIRMALPDEYAGLEMHVYLMVQTEDGRWSETAYGGKVLSGKCEVVSGECEVLSGERGVERGVANGFRQSGNSRNSSESGTTDLGWPPE